MKALIPLMFFIVVSFFILKSYKYSKKEGNKILEPIANSLNEGMVYGPFNGSLRGAYKGKPISMEIYGDDISFSKTVYIKVKGDFTNKFSVEKKRDGLFTRIFIGRYIKTGDPGFDDYFAVKGNPEEAVEKYFLNTEFKNSITELMGKYREIVLRVKNNEMVLYSYIPVNVLKNELSSSKVLSVIDILCKLSDMIH